MTPMKPEEQWMEKQSAVMEQTAREREEHQANLDGIQEIRRLIKNEKPL
jgi:hypothetical protein